MVPDLEQRARVAAFQARHRLALLTFLFTDMVGSMQLKQTLGDAAALELIARHHRLARTLLARFAGAEEIESRGDSFFLVFTRPSDAVHFALLFQHALRGWDADGVPLLRDRIGIHVGEVLVDDEATRLLGGLQIDACARLMGLGGADQILLSRFTFDSARQAFRGHELGELGPLSWLNHGHYLFKGMDDPMEVCEVGETRVALLEVPIQNDKAHRCTTADGEPVLGWRPAVGQQIPGTSWVLGRNLGAGGFGEVWLGEHSVLKTRRVFKFCFRADRARSLKREVTIFRLLRERLGAHPHIVAVRDVYLDEPPYYLVLDYVEGAALPTWAEAQGGLAAVPLAVRLEIVAQTAEALAAAHAAGVLHRDVKPSNLLIGGTAGAPEVKLADFGIGQVVSAEMLGGITQLGFTQTLLATDAYSGTQLYLSPELLTGRAATPQSDIYSLGIVLFQMAAGDFSRPLTSDWADAIEEPLLHADLRRCFSSAPARQFGGAAELAQQLRTLPERRAAAAAEAERRANAERLAYRRGLLRAAAVALVIVAVIAGLAAVAWWQRGSARGHAAVAARERDRAEQALTRLELQRAEELLAAQETPAGLAYLARVVRRDPQHPVAAARLLSALCDRSHALPLTDRLNHEKLILDAAFSPDGQRLAVTTASSTRIWDAASGTLLVGPLPFGGYRVLFTPDGQRLVLMGFAGRLLDAASGAVLAELPAAPGDTPGEARPDASLSADGRTLLTHSAGRALSLWDAQTGAARGAPLVNPEEIQVARFSADGRRIVTGGRDGRVCVWDLASGALEREWSAGARVLRLACSPDGTRIGVGLLDGRALLWDAASGAEIFTARQDEEITEVAFSPEGVCFLATSQDGSTRLWNAASGQEYPAAPRTRYRVLGGGFNPDGLRLFTRTAEGAVFIRRVRDYELVVAPIRPDAFPLVAVFSPEGARLATGCADGSVRIWQVEARAAAPLQLWPGAAVRDVATNGAEQAATAGADGSVQLWDLATARRGNRFQHGGPVALVRFSARAGLWLSAGDDGTVRLWGKDGTARGATMRTSGRVLAAEFAEDGESFVVVNEGRGAQRWTVATQQPAGAEFGGPALSAAPSRDAEFIVIGGKTGARAWDVRTGQPRGAAAPHKAPVGSLALSGDSPHFATGSHDGSARVWDAATGAPGGPEMPHGNVVQSVSFSPDHELLVTTSFDRLARLWDARTGQPRGAPLAHQEVALTAVFEPLTAQRVLTGGSDGFIRRWDARRAAQLAEPLRIGGPVRQIALDGWRVLAIGEAAHRATLWELPPELPETPSWLAAWAEAVGGRRLDETGALQPVPFAALAELRQQIAALSGNDEYTAASRWFFAPTSARTLSPHSRLSVTDYVRALGEIGSPEAALQALEFAPDDAAAWTAVILRRLESDAPLSESERAEMDWASRRATTLGPHDAAAWLARALALEQRDDVPAATAALDRATTLEPGNPSASLRKARARLLARAGRPAEAVRDNLALRGIAARDPQATAQQVDLSAYYNCRLDEDAISGDRGNTFAELPTGLQTFAGVTWDVRGLVQLGNADRLRRFPRVLRGIVIGEKCAALHFLHAAEFVPPTPGAEVARYVIHLADGSREEVAVRNGQEIADWWGEPPAPLTAAWHGANRLTREKNSRLNLFKLTWTNPRPEVAVTALDLLSSGSSAAPFVVAISRE